MFSVKRIGKKVFQLPGRRFVRNIVSKYPSLYMPLARPIKGDWLVSKSTDLVIEGYPRCGNSFAEACFRTAQHSPVRIAHHCHAAAQVILASKLKIPTVVLFRDPLEACRSSVMHMQNQISAASAFWEYCLFYQTVQQVRSDYVLASFETVTSDFGVVISKLNDRFGTDFDAFFHTDENEKKAFELLDELSRRRGAAGPDGETYSPKRSDEEKLEREIAKSSVKEKMQAVQASKQRERALRIYENLCGSSDV